jgi:hypothetical protein
MANSVTTQILVDGPRNLVVKLTGILDTADISATSLVTLANLSVLNEAGTLPTRLIIDKISYNVESGLTVNLAWDATTDVVFASLVNSGDDLKFKSFGGLYNTEASGVTGAIMYSTQGWSSGSILSFNVILEMRKK